MFFFVQQLQSAANYFTSMPDTTKRVFAPLRNAYRWSGATKPFHSSRAIGVTEAFRVPSGAFFARNGVHLNKLEYCKCYCGLRGKVLVGENSTQVS